VEKAVKKIKTAVIGVGKVTHLHAKALRNMADSEFAAVYSRDLSKAQMFAEQYGLKPYDDIQEMIHASQIDVVTICTPHPAHKDAALQAIQAGAHVLVEKPLAATLEDCDAMIEAAGKKKVLLGTISQRRYYEPALRVKRAGAMKLIITVIRGAENGERKAAAFWSIRRPINWICYSGIWDPSMSCSATGRISTIPM
jgi:predicted dehydrogenase